MKKRTILSGQSVKRKRKNTRNYSNFFRIVRGVFSLSLKILCITIAVVSISALFLYLYQYLISAPYVKLEEIRISGVNETIKRELIEISHLDR
jgi:cell division septal protein FtsQ